LVAGFQYLPELLGELGCARSGLLKHFGTPRASFRLVDLPEVVAALGF
jgi:hypothetical protein